MDAADDRTTEFLQLLSRCDRRLYAYVLSLVVSPEDADEIVQDTKVKLWQQFDRYERDTDFGAWACTVGYYEVLSFRKRNSARREPFSEAFLEAVSAQAAEMHDVQDDRRAALSRCLEKLDDASRQFVLRCYGAGQIKQIAADLDASVAATYQRLWRVRKRLHRCVETELRQEDSP